MKPSQDLTPSDLRPPLAPPAAFGRNGRLQIDTLDDRPLDAALAHDVRSGLLAHQKTLPPKYFYDDRGAQLFDAICHLPEYYLTRTEQRLLEDVADDIIAIAAPDEVVEFGSGASRKTRILLDALARSGRPLRYMPVDVCEGMLRRAALSLLQAYPRLTIHGIVGDYDQDLHRIPPGDRRLVLFLGSTIGNFTPAATARFLAQVRACLTAGDHLLLGLDLVKPPPVLEAAYNDGAGVTAEFNRNVLHVINRQLGGEFEPECFEHVAFFNAEQSQVEMHLRAGRAHTVSIRTLGLTVPFTAGETIHTEISRKFTRAEAHSTLQESGFALTRWYTPPNNYFGLALARAV